jgi:hypothetical protein
MPSIPAMAVHNSLGSFPPFYRYIPDPDDTRSRDARGSSCRDSTSMGQSSDVSQSKPYPLRPRAPPSRGSFQAPSEGDTSPPRHPSPPRPPSPAALMSAARRLLSPVCRSDRDADFNPPTDPAGAARHGLFSARRSTLVQPVDSLSGESPDPWYRRSFTVGTPCCHQYCLNVDPAIRPNVTRSPVLLCVSTVLRWDIQFKPIPRRVALIGDGGREFLEHFATEVIKHRLQSEE